MPAKHLNDQNSQQFANLKKVENNSSGLQDYLTLQELSKLYPYSQDYLSLLARRGKIKAKKFGRNWRASKEAVNDYINKQGLTLFLSSPASYKGKIRKPLSILPEKIAPVKQEKVAAPERSEPRPEEPGREEKQFFETLVDKLNKTSEKVEASKFSLDEREFVQEESRGFFHRFKKFNKSSKAHLGDGKKNLLIVISAIVLIFLIVGGISFGNVDPLITGIKNAFKDTTTLQGHMPGTHANEVLLLNEEGNVSIYGHLETQGQLRSWVEDGVAPIVVDSTTMVENLNAEMVGGLKGEEFTLAFVTKNGNLTTEDIFLEGKVEIGETLLVKGATKLLDSLLVNGSLGVWGDIVGQGDLRIAGSGSFSGRGPAVQIQYGDLVLEHGRLH